MNIIILTEKDKIGEIHYQLSDKRFEHIKNILKLEVNDLLEIGMLNGKIGTAKVVELNKDSLKIEIISLVEPSISKYEIDLICALPRPQTLKKVLTISSTMGVSNLYLIRSEKVEKSYFHSPLLDQENYSKYLIEGLSQGKKTVIPNITIYNKFKKIFGGVLIDQKKYDLKLLAHPNESDYLDGNILNEKKKILIAIGPEGGWNDYEIDYFGNNGFQKFKLSDSILRVESAVTAVLSQIELLKNT